MEDWKEWGGSAGDADLFERVWERVGAQQRAECPVESVKKGSQVDDLPVTGEEDVRRDRVAEDFPAISDLPCLGKRSAEHGALLQKHMMEELRCWQLYRHLARKGNGPNTRTLAMLASEKYRRARKLAAVHFLIAGVRYWPVEGLEVPNPGSWLGTLREQFEQEQRSGYRYRAAACDTEDPCLAELYSELAEGCAAHAAVLRNVLEGAL